MTQNEIIEMARQAGIGWGEGIGGMTDFLGVFAKLIADKAFQNGYEKGVAAFNDGVLLEREACAKLCDAFQERDVGMQPVECAGAIRARGQQ
jgi:hypothetical protein